VQEVIVASSQGERSVADGEASMGIGTTRTMERVAARGHGITIHPPAFAPFLTPLRGLEGLNGWGALILLYRRQKVGTTAGCDFSGSGKKGVRRHFLTVGIKFHGQFEMEA
jgi:hypothetical protein